VQPHQVAAPKTAADLERVASFEAEALTEVIDLSVAIATRVTKRQGLIDPPCLTPTRTRR
jgi:hypothetical protein